MSKIEAIAEIVESRQGLKAIELVCAGAAKGLRISATDIEEAVIRGEIIEIEYVIGTRVKSFLLPKGTKVERVRDQGRD